MDFISSTTPFSTTFLTAASLPSIHVWPWEVTVAPEYVWILIVGFIFAFVLSFGIGANDVANSFGTSVGAKVLTLRQACILATISESLGCILLGYRVSDTVRKGIISIELYDSDESFDLAIGFMSALLGACLWLLLATFFKLPVSGTHAIVGAVMGFTIVLKGWNGVNWLVFSKIVASWFVSPLLSGFVSLVIFYVIQKLIIQSEQKAESALRMLPIFYAVTLVINVFSITYDGPAVLHLDLKHLPVWGVFLLSSSIGCATAIAVRSCLVPHLRKTISPNDLAATVRNASEESLFSHADIVEEVKEKESKTKKRGFSFPPFTKAATDPKNDGTTKPMLVNDDASSEKLDSIDRSAPDLEIDVGDAKSLELDEVPMVQDTPAVARIFSFLQVLTACFGGFAHGGNDVSNSVGPIVALWFIAVNNEIGGKAQTPIWLLIFGAVGIVVGLWVWGQRTIETVGSKLTTITPTSGFCIELGAALTVLVASNIGLPVSTTHCKIGSVVFVGRYRSKENMSWKLFGGIASAWFLTVPASCAISALACYAFISLV